MTLSSLLARLRTWWRGASQSSQLDAEMDDEMRFHLDMQAERLARERRLDPVEARRQAFVAFGGVEKWKEAGRDTRGTQWIDGVVMDCRIGLRMLLKHRSLTVIGAFTMTVAIAIGATSFEIISEALNPALPFEGGERVVSIEYATELATVPEKPDVNDFADWRTDADSIQQLGAFRNVQYNLATTGAYPEPVGVAEITASAFSIARTPPQLGRYLQADDEREGAPRVVVIGHGEWQRRFGADPAIIGREIMLNAVPHTVVGVMPEGFAFPVNHQFWIALHANPARYERRQGPLLSVFGVLAPGTTRATAEAQLSTMHRRLIDQDAKTFTRLRPIVLPYTLESLDIDQPVLAWALRVVQLLLSGLLVIVAINLAILFYARTVTRLGEIAVRSALGASRCRILAQLFLEAFLLSALSAAAGLVLAHSILRWLRVTVHLTENVPFWISFDLSWSTIAYSILLAAIAALIVGVIPGLKTTGIRLDANLRALTGGTGLRLGAVWTTLIVAQVAAAVAILPVTVYLVSEVVRMEASGAGFPAERFMIAKVDRGRQAEVMRRVALEPGVTAVTLSSFIPGYAGDRALEFEDEVTRAREGQEEVTTMSVEPRLFDVYEASMIAGRAFSNADVGTATAIVNRTFEREFFPDGNVLGQRFSFVWRQASDSGTELKSFEIVGVVNDFPAFRIPGAPGNSMIYLPAAADELGLAIVTARFAAQVPPDFAGRLRQIGDQVDATSPVRDVTLLADFYARNRSLWRLISSALASITISVLLLSAAGIYALMSFTVAQRTREIGIRTALGGDQRRILAGVFGRVLRQLGIGVAIGSMFAGVLISSANMSLPAAVALVLAVGAVIVGVGVTATIGPARRSLRLPTTEALRIDS